MSKGSEETHEMLEHGITSIPPLFLNQLLESTPLYCLRFFPSTEDGLGNRDLKAPGPEQTAFGLLIPRVSVGAVQIEGGSPEAPCYQGDLGEYVAIPHPHTVGDGIGANTPYDAGGYRVLIP